LILAEGRHALARRGSVSHSRFEKRGDAKGKIDGFELNKGLSCLPVHSKKEKSIINF